MLVWYGVVWCGHIGAYQKVQNKVCACVDWSLIKRKYSCDLGDDIMQSEYSGQELVLPRFRMNNKKSTNSLNVANIIKNRCTTPPSSRLLYQVLLTSFPFLSSSSTLFISSLLLSYLSFIPFPSLPFLIFSPFFSSLLFLVSFTLFSSSKSSLPYPILISSTLPSLPFLLSP